MRNLLFGDYMNPDLEDDERLYAEVPSVDMFCEVVESCLQEYNQMNKNRMDLVIFRYGISASVELVTVNTAVANLAKTEILFPPLALLSYVLEHLSRISRVLKQPGGNALLVGVGGSGRQSITRLATSMGHMTMFQPEISKTYGITEWRDDLRVCWSYAWTFFPSLFRRVLCFSCGFAFDWLRHRCC